eukprot:12728314-Prorocentrum_lima.AAC.1
MTFLSRSDDAGSLGRLVRRYQRECLDVLGRLDEGRSLDLRGARLAQAICRGDRKESAEGLRKPPVLLVSTAQSHTFVGGRQKALRLRPSTLMYKTDFPT